MKNIRAINTPSGTGAGGGGTAISGLANSETTYTSGTVLLSALANMTIRSTTGQAFQFSVNAGGAETQTAISALYDGANSISSGTVRLTNANNFSFSINGQTLSGSVHAQQTGISALSNSNTTYTSGTVGLSELGAITIRSTTGNQFQFSVNSQTAQTGISGISNSNTTYTSGTVGLSELGAITIRSTTGNQFQFSVNSQTVQTQNMEVLYDGANSISSGTARFTNANGVTFTFNGQTVSGSVNESISMHAVSNTTQSSSGTAHKSALSFAGAGVASVGVTGGSVVISVAGAGADGGNVLIAGTRTAGVSSSVLFDNANGITFGLNANPGSIMTASHNALTSQSNQAASASNGSFAFETLGFSNANNVTFGTSAGSIVTASVAAPGGAANVSHWIPKSDALYSFVNSNIVNSQASVVRMQIPVGVTFSRVDIPFSFSTASSATANTAANAVSYVLQLLTRNASTISPIVGISRSATYTWASNTGQASSVTGLKMVSFALATSISPGEYYMALSMSTATSSVGTATTSLAMTHGIVYGGLGNLTVAPPGDMPGLSNSTINLLFPMQGVNTKAITNTTMTMQMSDITQTGGSLLRAGFVPIMRNI